MGLWMQKRKRDEIIVAEEKRRCNNDWLKRKGYKLWQLKRNWEETVAKEEKLSEIVKARQKPMK